MEIWSAFPFPSPGGIAVNSWWVILSRFDGSQYYVYDGLYGVEDATYTPRQFKLCNVECWADIVGFDEKTVADTATFEKPHAYAAGFSYVLVNGEVVIEGGKHTGARSGQILLGPGAQPPAQTAGGK